MDKSNYSNVINQLKFPLTIIVIMLHSYTSVRIINDSYWKLVYPFLTIGEMAVPCFFFISGFLYFFDGSPFNKQSYLRKTKNRLHSLLIPYLAWNFLTLLFYLIVQSIPAFSGYFSGVNKPISEYGLTDFIFSFWDKGDWDAGNGTPILQPFWYIRNLIIYCVCSPFIYLFIKYTRLLGVLLLCYFWFSTPGIAFLQSSLFFFTLGSYISKHNIDLFIRKKNYFYAFVYIYVTLFMLDYFSHTLFSISYPLLVHRTVLLLSIPMFFNLFNRLKEKIHFSTLLVQLSFFLYSAHYIIILSLRKVALKLLPIDNGLVQFISMFLCVFICVLINILIYKLMKSFMPSLLNILTGNRITTK